MFILAFTGLGHVGRLPQLATVILYDCRNITDAGLAGLVRACRNLQPEGISSAVKGDLFLAAVAEVHSGQFSLPAPLPEAFHLLMPHRLFYGTQLPFILS